MLTRILPSSVSRYFYGAPCQEDYYHPIKFLPPELLQEIFAFSASPFPDPAPIHLKEPPCQRFNVTPLFISHVCGQWRSLSFVTPEMWSWMNVSFPDESCVKLVQYYLHRTGKLQGLKLSFADSPSHFSAPPPAEERRWTAEIFSLWIPEAHRWTSIDFKFSSTPPMSELMNLLSHNMNRIASVSLRANWPEQTLWRFWETVHGSLSLREVQWPSQLGSIPHSAPLAQLTSIHVLHRDLSWTEFFSLSSSCARLRRLIVGVASISENESTSIAQTVVLPFLETLWLVSTPMEVETGLLLDYIRTPNLQELQVDASRSDKAILQRFLSQSGCSIRNLALYGITHIDSDEGLLVDCLMHAAPYLTDVRVCKLCHKALSTRTITALSPYPAGTISILLPSVLRLTLLMIDRVPEGLIGEMLLSRARHGVLPWYFQAHFTEDSRPQARDKDIIVQLESHGLHALLY